MDPQLAQAYAVVFLINLAPAFMPPTWSVLAFFLIRYDLPLLPLAIGGAVAASGGRLTLALISRRWGSRWLSPQQRASLAHVGGWLDTKARWAAPLAVLIYSFGPIPSNELFMAAGLSRMRLAPIVGAFLLGRIFSYTFFVTSASVMAERIEELFLSHWRRPEAFAVQILALAVLVVLVKLDWRRLLRTPMDDDTKNQNGLAAPPHL